MSNQFEHFIWEYLFAEIVDNFCHGEQLSYFSKLFYCCTSPWLKHESKP